MVNNITSKLTSNNLIGLFLVLFVLIAIPLTVMSTLNSRDERSQAATAVNDPCYTTGGDDCKLSSGVPRQWYLDTIKAPDAWDIQKGSASVKVALLDTGVAYASLPQDLVGQVATGYNFIDNNTTTSDDFGTYGSGTSNAGIIGSKTNNGLETAGVAWNLTILPVKICSANGTCTVDKILAGINWAVQNGAKVIQISPAKTTITSAEITALQTAINNATSAGAIVIAPVADIQSNAGYPAKLDNVIAVGGTNQSDQILSYSGQGPEVDLVAPAGSLTVRGSGGCCLTSSAIVYAASQVTGVATLLYSIPGITRAQVEQCIYQGVDDLGAAGKDNTFGRGRLNAFKAVQACQGGSSDTQAPTTPSNVRAMSKASGVEVFWTQSTDNVGVANYTILRNNQQIGVVSGQTIEYLDTSAAAPYNYTYTVVARDAANNSSAPGTMVALRACSLLDVTDELNDNAVDLGDALEILNHFGETENIAEWDMNAADGPTFVGIDLSDALENLQYFGKQC